MSVGYFECPELAGKTIDTIRVYNDGEHRREVEISLTDGTQFVYSLTVSSAATAQHVRPSEGVAQVLRSYNCD